MKLVKIILGSTREGRAGEAVAKWVLSQAKQYNGQIQFQLIDLKEVNLPFLDEPVSPMSSSNYKHAHTQAWSKEIDEADGFIFITPEYNSGYPAVLKNAIDFLYKEWQNKPVGLVGYGGSGGRHSIKQLREVLNAINLKPLEHQVGIGKIWEAFDEKGHLNYDLVRGDLAQIFQALDHELN